VSYIQYFGEAAVSLMENNTSLAGDADVFSKFWI